MKKNFFALAACIIGSQLHAQQTLQPTTDSSKILDEIVLTANKYPQKQSETGKVITVIGKDQLEKSYGKTIGELLNTVSGVTITGANNSPGSNLTTSIRGASAGNVLILIDGIPVNDPSVITNYFDLNFLPVNEIERIEILKGGQSTLYGSDAVAGVINIITKKPAGNKTMLSGGITGGSYNTFKENIGLTANNKKISYGLQYTHISSGGFPAATDSTGKNNFDKDGIDQHALSGNISFRLSQKLQWKIFSQYNYYKAGLDAGAFTDDKDYNVKNNNIQGGTGVIYHEKNGDLHFNYLFNYVSRDYLDDSTDRPNPYAYYSKSAYIGRTQFAELYNNWKWNNWELLTGADYRYNNTTQDYYSVGIYGPYTTPTLKAEMWQFSPYASLVYKDGNGFTTEAGLRWNHHSVYGDNFTYTLNPSYLLNDKLKFFINLYTAFKTPTLYQLYDPYAGNAKLKPETSQVTEGGIEFFEKRSFRIRVVGFYRNSSNTIQYIVINPSTYQSQYSNISNQKNYGLELEAEYAIQKWRFTANYTYTDGKTKSAYDGTGAPLGKDTTYFNLYHIPKNACNLSAGFQAAKNVYISTLLHTISKREEFIYGSNPVELKSYYTIDLYGEYKWKKNWKAFVDLRNITDQKYTDVFGYNTRKFNFDAGLSFSF
jgi:vitamin B12 transporter